MKKALVLMVCLAVAPLAVADYTFPAFSYNDVGQIPGSGGNDLAQVTQLDVSGVPAGTYYDFSVTAFWDDPIGIPWSNEANIFFLETADWAAPGTIYLNGTTPDNGQSNGDPIQLTWTGSLAIPYEGGDPLAFGAAQAYNGSTADWTDITIDLIAGTPPEAPTGPTVFAPSITDAAIAEPGEVDWYIFEVGAPLVDISINTFLTVDDVDPLSDTELGLYDANGALLANNDDAGSLYSEIITSLDPGTYYIAVGAFNTTFNPSGWDVTSSSSNTGNYTLEITPEPATLALLAIGGLALIRRR